MQWPNVVSNNHYRRLQNHIWVKDAFKGQDRPMQFSVIANWKFINMVSDYTLHWPFRNYH